MLLFIDAFEHTAIPQKYTCDGQNIFPTIRWEDTPPETKSFVLIVDDPDAPQKTPFVHLVVFNIPANITELNAESLPAGGTFGTNSFRNQRYDGPCPPKGHGKHRYRFFLFALDKTLDLPAGATRDDLDKATGQDHQKHILDRAEVVGEYERF